MAPETEASGAAPGANDPVAAATLLLIGCGKMGRALLSGWLAPDGPAHRIHVVEPDAEGRRALPTHARLSVHADAASLPGDLRPDVCILAMKPQQMDQALPPYRPFAAAGSCMLSIAAGRTIASFDRLFGAEAALVRAMPNTPAAIRRGVTALYANAHTTRAQKTLCAALMEAVGMTVWVADEDAMNIVTALSGGGPAYVFLLIETLAQAGTQAGLDPDLANRLARQTVIGAGELAHQAVEDPASLRRNVTSPGGTTKAALDVLMNEDGLQPLFNRALGAAIARSRELAGD
jgi:pyrroline-5-carboxylate reductase